MYIIHAKLKNIFIFTFFSNPYILNKLCCLGTSDNCFLFVIEPTRDTCQKEILILEAFFNFISKNFN